VHHNDAGFRRRVSSRLSSQQVSASWAVHDIVAEPAFLLQQKHNQKQKIEMVDNQERNVV
jgi:hypothetical protein